MLRRNVVGTRAWTRCQSLMTFGRMFALVLLIVVTQSRVLPNDEARGLSLVVESQDHEHLKAVVRRRCCCI